MMDYLIKGWFNINYLNISWYLVSWSKYLYWTNNYLLLLTSWRYIIARIKVHKIETMKETFAWSTSKYSNKYSKADSF